jgi:hypothetical protein
MIGREIFLSLQLDRNKETCEVSHVPRFVIVTIIKLESLIVIYLIQNCSNNSSSSSSFTHHMLSQKEKERIE